LLVGEQRK